jgi:hypothetical protein
VEVAGSRPEKGNMQKDSFKNFDVLVKWRAIEEI